MTLVNRNSFLTDLAAHSVELNTVILNHSGSPEKLFSDLSAIDLLSAKVSNSAFFDFCRKHPFVIQMKVFRELMTARVELEFRDGSELKINVVRNVFRKGLISLPAADIFRDAHVNEFGMLVPSVPHHYEYILMKHQFAGIEFPDRYRRFFSSMDFESRQSIFRYIQLKYHLVFNTIEELYIPKASIRLNLIVGLRQQNENSLFRAFFRSFGFFFFKLARMIFRDGKEIEIHPDKTSPTDVSQPRAKRQVIL